MQFFAIALLAVYSFTGASALRCYAQMAANNTVLGSFLGEDVTGQKEFILKSQMEKMECTGKNDTCVTASNHDFLMMKGCSSYSCDDLQLDHKYRNLTCCDTDYCNGAGSFAIFGLALMMVGLSFF